MAKINNKICCTCGTAYKFCPNCREDMNKPSYMNLYCSNDCRVMMIVASEFRAGTYDKEKAKRELAGINVNKRFDKGFSASIKKAIDTVLKENIVKNEKEIESQPVKELKDETNIEKVATNTETSSQEEKQQKVSVTSIKKSKPNRSKWNDKDSENNK